MIKDTTLKIGKILKNIYMKTYYSNKAEFISDGFETLYYFNVYNGTDLIEKIHDNVSNLMESSTKDLKEYQLEKYQGSAENDYNSSSKFSQLGIVSPKEDVYYYNEAAPRPVPSLRPRLCPGLACRASCDWRGS